MFSNGMFDNDVVDLTGLLFTAANTRERKATKINLKEAAKELATWQTKFLTMSKIHDYVIHSANNFSWFHIVGTAQQNETLIPFGNIGRLAYKMSEGTSGAPPAMVGYHRGYSINYLGGDAYLYQSNPRSVVLALAGFTNLWNTVSTLASYRNNYALRYVNENGSTGEFEIINQNATIVDILDEFYIGIKDSVKEDRTVEEVKEDITESKNEMTSPVGEQK